MTTDPSYATTDPVDVTPNPAIHNVPSTDTPSTQQQISVIGRADNLSTGTATGVASALLGGLSAGANPFSALATFGAQALGAIADIAQLLIQLGVDAIDGVVTIIQDAVQGVANLIAAIVNGLGGILGGTGTAADAQLVLTATAATIAASSAAIQSLQAQDAADSNNGVNVFINFSSGSLSGFTEEFSGAATGLEINSSGYAQLVTSGNGTGLALHPTPTNTDDQIVSAVYYNAPGSYNYFGLADGSGYDILIARANESLTTYVYAAISPIQLSLHNVVNGVDTVLVTQNLDPATFYAGAAYSLSCGFDGSNHPLLQIIVNGTGVLDFVDTTGVTNYGADYRYCGFGLAEYAGMSPSQVASFGFVDNAPGPVIGDMIQVGNESDTPITLANNIDCSLAPASYFSDVEVQTSNYTYDPTTNKITVSKSAIYNVRVMTQWVPNSSASYAYFGIGLFKNGLLYDIDVDCIASPGALPYYINKGAVFIGVQLDAGDYIQPGFVSYSNSSSYPNTIVGGGGSYLIAEIANTGTSG